MKTGIEKMCLRAAVLCCAAGLVVSAAHAQDTAPAPLPERQQGMGPGGPGARGGNPEQRMAMLKQQLNLSDDQFAQVKAIFADQRTKMMALRDDTTTPQQQKRGQMMGIMKDGDSKIEAILTPDQKTKYAVIREHMREQMRDRRDAGSPNAPPPPPPPPAPQQ